jgi:hypothetical protein
MLPGYCQVKRSRIFRPSRSEIAGERVARHRFPATQPDEPPRSALVSAEGSRGLVPRAEDRRIRPADDQHPFIKSLAPASRRVCRRGQHDERLKEPRPLAPEWASVLVGVHYWISGGGGRDSTVRGECGWYGLLRGRAAGVQGEQQGVSAEGSVAGRAKQEKFCS